MQYHAAGHRLRRDAGYTLMELMGTLAIAAIITGVSMPAMLEMLQRNRADAAPRQVMADIRFAQSQAIARGMQARLLIFDSTGQAPGGGFVAGFTDTTRANQYRVEARPTGGAWPALSDTVGTNDYVLSNWLDLAADYRQAVTQANAVAFTSRGSLLNSAVPIVIVLETAPGGASRTVRTNPSGLVEIQ